MISDNYEPKEKEHPEDLAETLLFPDSPRLIKGDTFLNLDSNAFPVGFENQTTFRGINDSDCPVSMTIRSDRNEDTMRQLKSGVT